MTTDDTLPHPPSRRDRLNAARHRHRRTIVVVLVLVVALAGAGAAAFAHSDHDSARASSDSSTTTLGLSPFADDAQRLAQLAEADPKRPLSHDQPLRLWVGGDSLAGALGMALGDLTSDTGIVDLYVDYKVSSGLASDDVRDWPERAAEAMSTRDPEAVVFMVGTNDTVFVDGNGEWEESYRQRVADLMDLFAGGDTHRTVIWIGAPTLRDEEMNEGAAEIDRVMREEADKRDDVIYLDAYALFSGDDGGYTSELQTRDGEIRRVRVGDGVHFTAAGGQHLAIEVFDLLDARWRIRAQADPDNPIGFDIAEGGEYDWTRDTQERSYSNDSPTSPTTTATAPPTSTVESTVPTTAPPATTTPPTTGPPPTTLPPTTVPSGGAIVTP
jgi:hypothetical protein